MRDEADGLLGWCWWRSQQLGHGVGQLGDVALMHRDIALQSVNLGGQFLLVLTSARSSTKARTTYTLSAVARSLLSTIDAIMVPCSVK